MGHSRFSENIHFDDVNVHGSLDRDPQNDAAGIQVFNSSNISIINSEFHELHRGVALSETNNINVVGNEFHDTARTAIFSQNVQKVVISENSFTNFRPVDGDHMDAIAFTMKADGTNTTDDVLISGNVITRGDGKVTQGIFFRDPSGVSDFTNIKIIDNIIVGMGYNGIYVNGAKNVTLSGNDVLSYEGKAETSWILLQNTDGATVSDNSASLISVLEKNGNTGIVESGSTIVSYVTDGGAAALKEWFASHADAGIIGDLTPTEPSVPSPVTAPLPETPPVVPSVEVESNPPVSVEGESIIGTSKDDHLVGTTNDDTIDGRGGYDVLEGGRGNDTYILPNASAIVVENAGEGIDTVIAKGNYVLGANIENLVVSDAGTNGWRGTGNELDNVITGNAGMNLLDGQAGNDTIYGGAGNDTLVGGKGNDLLFGGSGKDTFRSSPGDGADVISDFSVGDTLDIYAYIKAGMAPTIQDTGPNVVLSFGNGDSITLMGIDPSILKSAYFGFTS